MKLKFFNVGAAMREVWRLENELGLPNSDPILHIGRANKRVAELLQQRGEKTLPGAAAIASTSEPPAPVAPAVAAPVPVVTTATAPVMYDTPKPAPALTGLARMQASIAHDMAELAKVKTPTPRAMPANLAPAASRPNRKQCVAIIAACSPAAVGSVKESWTDDEVFLEAERAAFQAHVRFEGMRADSELEKEFWRRDVSKITGLARYERGLSQRAVDKILSAK